MSHKMQFTFFWTDTMTTSDSWDGICMTTATNINKTRYFKLMNGKIFSSVK
jgi:hypothetical protein